jgi:dihydroorotate dehydrogenase (NAD+) catalytic subunit
MKEFGVSLSNLSLKNPIMVASGTFGFGFEYRDFYDTSILGAIVSKGISLSPRQGNYGNRILEIKGGLINSIGLENPGIDGFVSDILPKIEDIKTTYIVNVLGSDSEEYINVVSRLKDIPRVDGVEINISCPNVKSGGLSFGRDLNQTRELARSIREIFPKPIIFKLSADLPYIEIAKIMRDEGIDAVTCINTIQSLAIDIDRKDFYFKNIYGGLSGPAIKPVALRVVYQVSKEVGIPVIGCGGIMSYQDVIEFFMAGATAVQIGTANFCSPDAAKRILEDTITYLKKNKISSVEELRL